MSSRRGIALVERAPEDPARVLVLELPEPPTLNMMLDMAKERTRFGKPLVYAQNKVRYGVLCDKATRDAGIFPPRVPWRRWRITRVAFRLHQLRDPVEVLAALKWPVDWLVGRGFVADDSCEELLSVAAPSQVVDRLDRGVTLTVEAVA